MSNAFDKSKYGFVFNIQHYSIHDGPGIRTLVFLKGCPLKCSWCSNPESQQLNPEMALNTSRCIGIDECNRCSEVCPAGAILINSQKKIEIDRVLCNNCLRCADACPSKALSVFGKLMSVEEVLEAVEKDSIFYSRSEGGLTISGGEALAQADFTAEILKEAKRRRIDTSLETSGHAEWDSVEKVCQYLDTIFYDIKCIDSSKHKRFTGVANERILENFNRLCASFPSTPVTVRTPVIPGFNDTEEDILSVINFIESFPNVKYELLEYHRLGEPKYGYIGREYPLGGTPVINEEHMAALRKLVKAEFNS